MQTVRKPYLFCDIPCIPRLSLCYFDVKNFHNRIFLLTRFAPVFLILFYFVVVTGQNFVTLVEAVATTSCLVLCGFIVVAAKFFFDFARPSPVLFRCRSRGRNYLRFLCFISRSPVLDCVLFRVSPFSSCENQYSVRFRCCQESIFFALDFHLRVLCVYT